MTDNLRVSTINANGLPLLEHRNIGIPAIMIYSHAMIKLSDYHKYREECDLGHREVLIAPDDLWHKLEKTVGKE